MIINEARNNQEANHFKPNTFSFLTEGTRGFL
jgi:hypothetical protein